MDNSFRDDIGIQLVAKVDWVDVVATRVSAKYPYATDLPERQAMRLLQVLRNAHLAGYVKGELFDSLTIPDRCT